MSPTPLRDPNAPPDPTELRDIPDHQMAPDTWVGYAHNPVPPGAPPDPDYPTGVPPDVPTDPPPPIDGVGPPQDYFPGGRPPAFPAKAPSKEKEAKEAEPPAKKK